MKALTFTGIQSITYEDIPDPIIEDQMDVIVKTSYCAICGSDLHIYHGREHGIDSHTAMGHEFTGEVVEAGSAVTSLKLGDQVVSAFTTACGQCFFCLRGLSARCIHNQIYGWRENGKGLQGAQAEYVRVPLADHTLMPYLPYGLTGSEAILAGDILSTGYFGALLCELKPEDTVVIIGCGPVGLMAIWSAAHAYAGTVIGVDLIDDRLVLVSGFGGLPLKLNKETIEAVKEMTQGRGADAVIEAVGNESAQKLAYDLVRPGGIIATIGVHTTDQFVFKPADVYDKNLTYKSGRCPARSLMPVILPLIGKNKKQLASLFTHHLPLDQGVRAYDIFDKKQEGCIKVLLQA